MKQVRKQLKIFQFWIIDTLLSPPTNNITMFTYRIRYLRYYSSLINVKVVFYKMIVGRPYLYNASLHLLYIISYICIKLMLDILHQYPNENRISFLWAERTQFANNRDSIHNRNNNNRIPMHTNTTGVPLANVFAKK